MQALNTISLCIWNEKSRKIKLKTNEKKKEIKNLEYINYIKKLKMSFDKDLIKPLCLKIVVAGQILRIADSKTVSC